MEELKFIVKTEGVLGDLEVELREIVDAHEDIYSNEHIQTRELLKKLITFRNVVTTTGGKLIGKSDLDF